MSCQTCDNRLKQSDRAYSKLGKQGEGYYCNCLCHGHGHGTGSADWRESYGQNWRKLVVCHHNHHGWRRNDWQSSRWPRRDQRRVDFGPSVTRERESHHRAPDTYIKKLSITNDSIFPKPTGSIIEKFTYMFIYLLVEAVMGCRPKVVLSRFATFFTLYAPLHFSSVSFTCEGK
jgi:hypothetical protein